MRGVYASNHTELGPVQSVSNSQQGGQRTHPPPHRRGQHLRLRVGWARKLLPMAPRHQGEYLDVQRVEAEQLPRPDEIRGVAMVATVVDRMADVVQERGVLERLAGRGRQ